MASVSRRIVFNRNQSLDGRQDRAPSLPYKVARQDTSTLDGASDSQDGAKIKKPSRTGSFDIRENIRKPSPLKNKAYEVRPNSALETALQTPKSVARPQSDSGGTPEGPWDRFRKFFADRRGSIPSTKGGSDNADPRRSQNGTAPKDAAYRDTIKVKSRSVDLETLAADKVQEEKPDEAAAMLAEDKVETRGSGETLKNATPSEKHSPRERRREERAYDNTRGERESKDKDLEGSDLNTPDGSSDQNRAEHKRTEHIMIQVDSEQNIGRKGDEQPAEQDKGEQKINQDVADQNIPSNTAAPDSNQSTKATQGTESTL
ncbi:hypothetical protein MMC10_003710 [Thelotrema lepadinum]|nr:hypothetical protein [Thelotrema lepadinum]